MTITMPSPAVAFAAGAPTRIPNETVEELYSEADQAIEELLTLSRSGEVPKEELTAELTAFAREAMVETQAGIREINEVPDAEMAELVALTSLAIGVACGVIDGVVHYALDSNAKASIHGTELGELMGDGMFEELDAVMETMPEALRELSSEAKAITPELLNEVAGMTDVEGFQEGAMTALMTGYVVGLVDSSLKANDH